MLTFLKLRFETFSPHKGIVDDHTIETLAYFVKRNLKL